MIKQVLQWIEVLAVISSVMFGVLWLRYPDQPFEPPFAVSGFILILIEVVRRKLTSPSQEYRENIQQKEAEFVLSNEGHKDDPAALLNEAAKIRQRGDDLSYNSKQRALYFSEAEKLETKARLIIKYGNA